MWSQLEFLSSSIIVRRHTVAIRVAHVADVGNVSTRVTCVVMVYVGRMTTLPVLPSAVVGSALVIYVTGITEVPVMSTSVLYVGV